MPPRIIGRIARKAGNSPGSLVHIGDRQTGKTHISLMDYDGTALRENRPETIEEALALRDSPATTWINIDGVHDLALIERVGRHFGIHPLTLEDIVNTTHRPKVEVFADYLFVLLKMLYYDDVNNRVTAEQVSIVLGRRWLLAFQEVPGDVFDPVRRRIRDGNTHIRRAGCDYLAYALVDTVVDHYFLILDHLGARLERIEDQLVDARPDGDLINGIHALRREVIHLQRQAQPMGEIVRTLRGETNGLVQENTRTFLGDVADHVVQINDTLDSYRDLSAGMLDLYLSLVSNRMNEVMKVLTIIATIFIPLTFVAGIYGMNFRVMPELEWRWGYPLVWVIMIVVAVGLLIYFRRKKWL